MCVDGKIKTRTRKSVGEGFPLVGRDTGVGKGKILILCTVVYQSLCSLYESTGVEKRKCGTCFAWITLPL